MLMAVDTSHISREEKMYKIFHIRQKIWYTPTLPSSISVTWTIWTLFRFGIILLKFEEYLNSINSIFIPTKKGRKERVSRLSKFVFWRLERGNKSVFLPLAGWGEGRSALSHLIDFTNLGKLLHPLHLYVGCRAAFFIPGKFIVRNTTVIQNFESTI